jgi:hypothetical protein
MQGAGSREQGAGCRGQGAGSGERRKTENGDQRRGMRKRKLYILRREDVNYNRNFLKVKQ